MLVELFRSQDFGSGCWEYNSRDVFGYGLPEFCAAPGTRIILDDAEAEMHARVRLVSFPLDPVPALVAQDDD